MGRKPLSTATKEASGAFVKDPQRRNHDEPTPIVGRPPMPASVEEDQVAKDCWNRVCDELQAMRVLTRADVFLLEQYATNYSQWRWLSQMVREGNCRDIGNKGNVVTSPEAQQVHKYADRLLKILVELGLTPSARTKIKVVTAKDDDPFSEWLKGASAN